jgi:hypothetical protein
VTARGPVRAGLAVAALLAVAVAAGCGGGGGKKTPAASNKERGAFSHPTRIDNRWFPLQPGTKVVFEGRTNRGKKRAPHRIVFVVTDLTKTIDGVRTVVTWDRDYTKDRLVEGELAFFAQDDAGAVWAYGEYPEEWEGSKLAGAPSTWIPGVAGARPGVMMQAGPRTGTREYLQGWAPTIAFEDRAKVTGFRPRVCVPVRCYENVLVTEERSPDEPKARQIKFYARGAGNVRVGFKGEGQNESLVLVKIERLDAPTRERLAKGALELDRRGYSVAPKVYGKTPRAVSTGT